MTNLLDLKMGRTLSLFPFKHSRRKCCWQQATGILVLSSMMCFSGWVPRLTHDFSRLEFTSVAYAQDLLPKVKQYAKAVTQIEPLRIQALMKVQQIMRRKTPINICRQKGLPDTIKNICTDYYNQSADVIQRNGLTNWEFNQITKKVKENPIYRERLDDELVKGQ